MAHYRIGIFGRNNRLKYVDAVRLLLIDDSTFSLYGLKTVLSRTGSIGVVGMTKTEAKAFAP
jgi:hypothetical protein